MDIFNFPLLRHVLLLLATVLLVCANGVWAAATCKGGGTTLTAHLPTTLSVPRDVAVGTVLTPWVTTDWVKYTCNVSNQTPSGIWAAGTINGSFPITTPAKLPGASSSTDYRVLQTSVSGIGLAVAVNVQAASCALSWKNVLSPSMGWVGTSCNANGNVTNRGRFAVALIKTGTVAAGTLSGQTVAKTNMVISGQAQGDSTANYLAIPQIRIIPMTCATPDVPVQLGSHFSKELRYNGATTIPVNFNISLNNCPAGMKTIRYRIDPTTGVIYDTLAVVAPTYAPGNASGVGIQLLDSSGTPFKLESWTTFSGYNPGTGGSYAIPMKARYYTYNGNVTPGPANTAMTVTMSYQ